MKRSLLPLLLLLALLCTRVSAQDPLADIVQDDRNYQKIVKRGDAYFAAKHPGKSATELSLGEGRDGQFVKWQRWKHYWSERLNADGTLGSPFAYFQEQRLRKGLEKAVPQPYENVAWTNINYTDYIVGQIGLGRTEDIAFHPTDVNTFYVAAQRGGVWKTTDGGSTYAPLTDNLPLLNARSLVVDQSNPDNVYALFGEIGVYKSTDAGLTWEETAFVFPPDNSVYPRTMTADPNDANRLLVVARDGTFETTDGFETISQINGLNGSRVRFQPGNSELVLIADVTGRIHRSTDGGATFIHTATLASSGPWLEFSTQDPNYVYASCGGEHFYRSTDAGLTFTERSDTLSDGAVFIVAPGSRDTIIKGYFDIVRSTDGGLTWTQIMDWVGAGGLPSIHVDTRRLRTNPLEPDAIYFCNDGGVYRYSVSGNSWTNLSDGLVITQYYDIAVAQTDANIIGGGSQDNGNVFRQSDGSWLQYATTGDGMNQAIDPTDASIRYWEYQNGSLHRYQNGINTSIRPVPNGGAWETPYKLDPSNPARIIAGYVDVWESLDRGDSWSKIGDSLALGGRMNQMAIAPTDPERIYVSSGAKLFVKSSVNDTWAERALPSSAADLEVDPFDENRIYIVKPGYTSGQKVYVSNDAGVTWENLSLNLPNLSYAAIETYREIPGGIFVGGDDGVYYTDSLLSGWQRYGDLPNSRVEDIEIQYAAGLIRVGTYGRGVLEAPIIVETCLASSPDADGDGRCDFIDDCPVLDDNLIGQACDDGDPNSTGEKYSLNCDCSGGASNLEFCAAEGSNGTGSDYIRRVALNDLDHVSGQSNYSDFTDQTANLEAGATYRITVDMQAVFGPDRVHGWVDWNRNEVFDADELLAFTVPSTGAQNYGEAYADVAVPIITSGVTTLRVRAIYNTTIVNPCGSNFGEVEDYTIQVNCDNSVAACALLPLDFTAFEARSLGKRNALLTWETADEEDVDHYRIERSANGRDFEAIGRVSADNQPSATYDFVDETVASRFAYYRIAGVDFDGAETTSPLRRVDFLGSGAGLDVELFPNPVGAEALTLRWRQATADDHVRYLVYNQFGQEIQRGTVSGNAGGNVASVPTNDLPAGVYLLRLRGTDFDWTGNFVRR